MYFINECAICLLVAIIVSGLAVTTLAIYMLVDAASVIIDRRLRQFMEGAPWMPATMWVARHSNRKP